MSMLDAVRVLIVHDDPVAEAGLSAAFRRYPDLKVLEDDGNCLGRSRSSFGPGVPAAVDVVVADYPHGIALATDSRRTDLEPVAYKIVIVAPIDREWEIRRALECGVRGYILAGAALEELVSGVRAVHKGARYLSPPVANRLAESIFVEALTAREEDVMRLVLDGLGNKAVARQLGITEGTVKSHLKLIYGKLGVQSRTQAVVAVERRGLLRRNRHLTKSDASFREVSHATPQHWGKPVPSGYPMQNLKTADSMA